MSFKEKFRSIFAEVASAPRSQQLFILFAMFCGFFISMGYAIARPVSNSVFITAYTTHFFPYAWLAAVPLNLAVVGLYNHFLPKLGCVRMMGIVLMIIAGGDAFCGLFMQKIPGLPFLYYIWKEIYVMLLFQQLWSVIHSTVQLKSAKFLFGIFFAVGACGGVLGNMIPGFFAVQMGSENLLFLTFPVYASLMLLYFMAVQNSETIRGGAEVKSLGGSEGADWRQGFKLIKNSPFLTFILLTVILMQLSSSIIDYQFNSVLERTILDKDHRTEYTGRILGLTNAVTIGLQCFGAFLLIHFLGLKRSHLFVPLALCCNAVGFLIFPAFGMISLSYVTIKAFDFSIFGVIREMLYIPLKLDEKFRAKAVIDVFAHRTSKAAGSFLILAIQFIASAYVVEILSWGIVAIFLSWAFLVFSLFKKYESVEEAA